MRDVLSHARPVAGLSRQVTNAALLGLCFVLLATCVPVSPLDTPLRVAVYAFVVAIPLLSLVLVSIAFEYKPGMSRPGERFAESQSKGFQLVCELPGAIAVLVGVTAVVWHLAGWVAVGVGYGVLVLAILVSLTVGTFSTAPRSPTTEASTTQQAPAQHGEQGEARPE